MQNALITLYNHDNPSEHYMFEICETDTGFVIHKMDVDLNSYDGVKRSFIGKRNTIQEAFFAATGELAKVL